MSMAMAPSEESPATLKQVKRPRTEKQEIVAEALEDHAVVLEGGQVDVQPALEHLREVHGQDYTSKGYLWQVLGEFFVVERYEESVDEDRLHEEYRSGYRDGFRDAHGN